MPTETYRSKVDTWLLWVLWSTPAVVLVAAGSAAWSGALPIPVALLVVASASLLPWWLIRSTRYELSETTLRVRSGPWRWDIPITDIRAIVPTRSPLSSPALSLERLRIEYGTGRSLMISPVDPERFLRALEARR
jgi:membrane protein YdbS with pleckstrin-like domain